MIQILPQQVIINAGQLFAAIDEELIKLIPRNCIPQPVNNEWSKKAVKEYQSGYDHFQTTDGTHVDIIGRTAPAPEPPKRKYAIPMTWRSYKMFEVEAETLNQAIQTACFEAIRAMNKDPKVTERYMALYKEKIKEMYPDEEAKINWRNY